MSQREGSDGSSNKGRRGFKVEGEDAAAVRAPKPRTIDEALRLGQHEAPALADGQTAYNPTRVRAFLEGRITLGDLEGITKQEQYQMAEVGYSYVTSGKLDDAETVFEGLIALDPFDAYFHTALGSIAQQRDQHDEAEKRYSRALEINPFFATAMANRGEVRVVQGRLAEGAEDLIRAVQSDPEAKEPATVRARATLNVLREQLQAAAESQPQKKASPSAPPSASRASQGPRPAASRPAPARSAASPSGRSKRRPTPRKK